MVQSFKDTSRPLSQRAAGIRALAAAGDADSIGVLSALGDEGCYLSWVAVEALGSVSQPALKTSIVEYLKGKLSDDDPRVAEAAIRAYGRLAGEDAVSSIAAAIRRNRSRADGYGEIVNAVAARTLGTIGSSAAVPILASELSRANSGASGAPRRGARNRNSGAWDFEYGSQLVAALGRIDAAEARRAIGTYAAWMSSHLPQDPMARRYVERKIDEARRAAPGE
jgi:HEAT repeat protein